MSGRSGQRPLRAISLNILTSLPAPGGDSYLTRVTLNKALPASQRQTRNSAPRSDRRRPGSRHVLEFHPPRFLDLRRHEDEGQERHRRVKAVSDAETELGKHGKCLRYDKVRDPLGRRRDSKGIGANAVIEHFAEQDPQHGAPAHAKEHDVEIRGHDRDTSIRRAQHGLVSRRIDRRSAEHISHRPKRRDHADGADEQQGLATQSIDQRNRHQRHHDIGRRREDRDRQRICLTEADCTPQRRRIVEDDVDADELLEHRQQNADPHDRKQTESWACEILKATLPFLANASLDLRDFLLRRRNIADKAPQDIGGLGQTLLSDEIARRLRNHQGQHAIDGGGKGGRKEHPAPCLPAKPQPFPWPPRCFAESVVTEKSDENANDDGELLERAEAAAIFGWRNFGDVSRSNNARGSDGGAPKDAEDRQHRDVNAKTGSNRADEEDCRSDEHDQDAAVAVGQRASEPGADRGAQKGAGDRETEHRGADPGPVLYRVNRAVDYRGVKTEQESSHRSGSGDEDNFTESDASIELAVVRGISYDRHKYLVIYYDNCAGASDRRAHSIRT